MIEDRLSKIMMIVPCFNEGNRLNLEYWQRITQEVSCEWLFINDGSTDNTINKLELINGIKILSFEKNEGKAESIRKGINYIIENPELDNYNIGYIDSDDAFIIDDIKKVLDKFININENFDAIWASRVALAGRNISRNSKRHLISRVIVTLLGVAYPEIPYDPQTGFKIFKAHTLSKELISKKFKTRWFVDLEILTRIEQIDKRRVKIWEEPVSYWRDIPGTKIKGLELVRVVSEIFKVFRILQESRKNQWI